MGAPFNSVSKVRDWVNGLYAFVEFTSGARADYLECCWFCSVVATESWRWTAWFRRCRA